MKIRLTESTLKQIVNESIQKVLNEDESNKYDRFWRELMIEMMNVKDLSEKVFNAIQTIEMDDETLFNDAYSLECCVNRLSTLVGEAKCFYNSINEGRIKKEAKKYNIDGAEYEETDVMGGGMLHPGFRWKDHESHDPEKSKIYRKRKDGYRYAQEYCGNPRRIHNYLANK